MTHTLGYVSNISIHILKTAQKIKNETQTEKKFLVTINS